MKKIVLLILIFIPAIVFFSGCDESQDPAGVRGGIVPSVTNVSPSFYDLLTLEESFIQFSVDVEEKDRVDEVIIVASYNRQMERIDYSTITSFPSEVTITAVEIAERMGLSVEDLGLGDVFTLEIVVVEDGVRTRSNTVINPNVACASDIAGVYNLEASGVGGGGLGAADPWTSSVETVEITSKDGGVTYNIEPALGGIMEDFYAAYGGGRVVGEFQDICGSIENPVVNDGWNDIVTYSGSIDLETGEISIYFENAWGDNGNMTLTPQ